MSFSAVDLDWCLTCSKHLDTAGTPYCSPKCEPSPSRPVYLSLNAGDWSDYDDDDEEERIIFHNVKDTSPYKGIAAWAANVPTGAPPTSISCTPSDFTSQPKLLHPQSSRRPVPPALSMSSSSSTSTPLATPLSHKPTVLSSLASHVKSLVSSSSGLPISKPRTKTKDYFRDLSSAIQVRSSSPSFVSFSQDSPTDSSSDDMEDQWWVTESDSSSASSMVIKKSSAQSILMGNQHHELVYFQPTVLPIELSSRKSKLDEDFVEKREQAWRSRGRRASRTAEDCW